jgi:hypothetical protein
MGIAFIALGVVRLCIRKTPDFGSFWLGVGFLLIGIVWILAGIFRKSG